MPLSGDDAMSGSPLPGNRSAHGLVRL